MFSLLHVYSCSCCSVMLLWNLLLEVRMFGCRYSISLCCQVINMMFLVIYWLFSYEAYLLMSNTLTTLGYLCLYVQHGEHDSVGQGGQRHGHKRSDYGRQCGQDKHLAW